MKSALSNFQTLPLKDAARQFLAELGYKSYKFLASAGSSPQAFLDLFGSGHTFDEKKALFDEWKTADLLFQLTDQELSRESSLFTDDSVQRGLLKSYIFIAIELKGGEYARGKFSAIARQINRLFPMPVMVFFKHQSRLTIAVINRRRNKIDESKDVLEKATIIRDINFAQPHRGHLDILDSLAFPNLVHPKKLPITDFDTLHAAWEQIFNVELLNERFYRELANWYFWALPQVEFPADLEPDDEKRRATSLIRLLTRLIFCWFLKEKNLIPENLFHPTDLARILKGFDPESETSSTYYLAILQNLFFATLNQRMGKDSNGKPYRFFATDEGFAKNRATYDINTLYRYEKLFACSPDEAIVLFADIPFLNGGLFECLDRTEDGTDKKRYLDGFSRNAKKRPHVPDRLFFDSGETADLSTAYGDTKRKAEKVTGLISILNRYKFTIVENTPIDQEIALDPELLGKVFENLLASYNEETKTTARKQTGSFYTPRPIVEYMVDESLKAHLSRALVEKAKMKEADARAGLDLLFAYTEKEHPFAPPEVACLIAAIDALKALDPACGSGAFPMGVLHKLVYILGKLDPDNERWKQTQLAKLDSAPMREQLEAAFADNADDYGRKLYLIENCLYGVDIQPIAIQITKLRFFISLVCDQKTNRNKKENHGIRPLPNLETKFVAANSLIGLPEMTQSLLVDPRVGVIEKEIESLYHTHFSIQRRDQKLALQRKIKSLRQELAKLLAESLISPTKAKHIAEWDPFDPQSCADFFDPHWMFGRSMAGGCDVVIGNPPYIKERDSKHVFDVVTRSSWGAQYHEGKMDYWYFFLHRALEITRTGGIVSYITSRYWINSAGSKKLIKHIQECASLFHVVDIGDLPVFEQVAGHHMLHFYRVDEPQSSCLVKRLENSLDDIALSTPTESLFISRQSPDLLFNSSQEIRLYESKIAVVTNLSLGDRYEVSQGVVQNPDKVSTVMSKRYGLPRGAGVFVLEEPEFKRLRLNSKESGFVKAFYDESSVSPFRLERRNAKYLLYITKKNCPTLSGMPNIERHLSPFREIMNARRETVNGTIEWFQLHWPRDPRFFESDKVVLPSMFRTPSAAYVPEAAYFGLGSNVVIGGRGQYRLKTLAALLNSSVGTWWFLTNSKKRGVGVDVGVDRLRQFPLPSTTTSLTAVESLTSLVIATLSTRSYTEGETPIRFFLDLIDACVMECYFRVHMAERDLLFLDDLAPHLSAFDPSASESQQREFIAQLHRTLNAPSSKIRNRLLRISADSPDLLAVIKEGGSA